MDTEFATRCIHLPEEKQLKDRYGAMTFPIYQTATFAHPGPGRSTGYDYSRSMNPSRDYVERVVASLEEGCGAIAASSGMAAVSLVMELFSPGDTILIDSDLYGGSLRLFRHIGEKTAFASVKSTAVRIRLRTRRTRQRRQSSWKHHPIPRCACRILRRSRRRPGERASC